MILAADHDGPYPLIPITCSAELDFADHSTRSNITLWLADELALTHNVIIRALNSIWLNAPLLLPGDEPDFVGYALACLLFVREHHRAQEEVVFPHLQVKLDMRSNAVDHIAFEAPLKRFESYLERVRDGAEKYDAEKVLACRNEVGNIMVQHFHDEVECIAPGQLRVFTNEDLENLLNDMEEHNKKIRQSATLLSFIVTNHRREDAVHWPVMSTSRKWIGHHIGQHLHRGYWRFSPYTMTGESQNPYPHQDDDA